MLGWFRINSLKANSGEFQFMVLGTSKVNSYDLCIDGVNVFCKITWNNYWQSTQM